MKYIGWQKEALKIGRPTVRKSENVKEYDRQLQWLWRKLNPQAARERDRARHQKHREKRIEYHKYWNEKNRHKKLAQREVIKAIAKGILKRKECEVCGSLPTHAHHSDYSKPLFVKWLCPSHHQQAHSKYYR